MPNWCNGWVRVHGKPKNVEAFCKLFVFEEDVGNKTKMGYFARSFAEMSWGDFKKENLGGHKAEFNINFAWSCYTCLIDGYPQRSKECVTLEWACRKYNVLVLIDTEEEAIGFEEHIECDGDGNLTNECENMKCYECKCGNKQMIASSYDVKDVECWECEKYNSWKEVKEDGA